MEPLIELFNEKFDSLHVSDIENYIMDGFEEKHIDMFHQALPGALKELDQKMFFDFGKDKRFICIWLSGCEIKIDF